MSIYTLELKADWPTTGHMINFDRVLQTFSQIDNDIEAEIKK